MSREVEARFDLESYLSALNERISDPEKWGVEDVGKHDIYGQPTRLGKIRRIFGRKWRRLVVNRGIREIKDMERIKKIRLFFFRL